MNTTGWLFTEGDEETGNPHETIDLSTEGNEENEGFRSSGGQSLCFLCPLLFRIFSNGYMKLLDIPIGLLINFHEPILKNGISRMILPRANQAEPDEDEDIAL